MRPVPVPWRGQRRPPFIYNCIARSIHYTQSLGRNPQPQSPKEPSLRERGRRFKRHPISWSSKPSQKDGPGSEGLPQQESDPILDQSIAWIVGATDQPAEPGPPPNFTRELTRKSRARDHEDYPVKGSSDLPANEVDRKSKRLGNNPDSHKAEPPSASKSEPAVIDTPKEKSETDTPNPPPQNPNPPPPPPETAPEPAKDTPEEPRPLEDEDGPSRDVQQPGANFLFPAHFSLKLGNPQGRNLSAVKDWGRDSPLGAVPIVPRPDPLTLVNPQGPNPSAIKDWGRDAPLGAVPIVPRPDPLTLVNPQKTAAAAGQHSANADGGAGSGRATGTLGARRTAGPAAPADSSAGVPSTAEQQLLEWRAEQLAARERALEAAEQQLKLREAATQAAAWQVDLLNRELSTRERKIN